MDATKLISDWLASNKKTIAHCLTNGGFAYSLTLVKNRMADDLFSNLLAEWNHQRGSRARKPRESFLSTAKARGITISENTPDDLNKDWWFSVTLNGQEYFYIIDNGRRFLQPGNTIQITPDDEYYSESKYRVTMEAPDVFDFLVCYTAMHGVAMQMWKQTELEICKGISISRISFPLIARKLENGYAGKNIKYFISEDCDHIDIYINLVKELWYQGPISMDNVEHIITFTPYAIKRPDDKKILGAGFRVTRDWRGQIEAEYKAYWESKGTGDA